MPHAEVRDFLAALALAARHDFPSRALALRRDPRRLEMLLLALHELRRRSTPHVGRLLVRLLMHPPDGADVGVNDMMLAATCLAEMGGRSRPDSALRAEIRVRLLELIQNGSAFIADRVRAGMLLGRLGDPRLEGAVPALAQVDAGAFVLGADDGYEDEGPAQMVDLAAFAIGIYPVTNQEYAAFLAERPGYARPRYWHDPRFNNPSCPVVGISWHDANAYCTWLTTRLARAGLLAPGAVARLPSEFEWEKAASWDAARKIKLRYPWGDDWDSQRANTADRRGDWLTAPVGCYSAGISPYGLHGCIGNVWEWTASVYASYPGVAAPFREAGSYTLRGSSCVSNSTHARCTYRSRLPAGYWRYHLGFRVVVGLPL
jgi:gamma-glutamyl hercynylcysteine S-oxide synthase